VGGSGIEVTVSLFTALRRFRYPDTRRVLWADAICINQGDNNERSSQIQLMGRVYKACWEVLIWLGEEDDFRFDPRRILNDLSDHRHEVARFEEYIKQQNIQHVAPLKTALPSLIDPKMPLDIPAAINLLQLFADGKHLYELPIFQIEAFPKFAICPRWYNVCSSLIHFLSRPWFKRLWTIQEAVLPPKAILQLGKSQVDLEILFEADKSIIKHSVFSDCCTPLCGLLWEAGRDGQDLLSVSFGRIRMTELSEARFFSQQQRAASFTKGMTVPLRIARERAVTDPHDCIYGLLGIFPNIMPETDFPDYDIDIACLFSRCTKRLFEETSSLERFRDIHHRPSDPYNLPSWCLNWNQPQELFMDEVYNSCGAFQQYRVISCSQHDRVLAVEATFLGKITSINYFTKSSQHIGKFTNAIMSWQTSASEVAGITGDAFWKILFLDRPVVNRNRKRNPNQMPEMYPNDFFVVERWWKWLLTLDPTKHYRTYTPYPDEAFEDCFAVFDCIHAAETSTALYSTNTELVGITRSGIWEDDSICVCKGSPIPLILRPCDGGMYSLVGVSYVHVIMDGSATVDAKWETVNLC